MRRAANFSTMEEHEDADEILIFFQAICFYPGYPVHPCIQKILVRLHRTLHFCAAPFGDGFTHQRFSLSLSASTHRRPRGGLCFTSTGRSEHLE